jgi:adenine deaminase
VDEKLTLMHKKAREELGINENVEPLMTLCFMALPVIPELKLTARGLFDVRAFSFIPVDVT